MGTDMYYHATGSNMYYHGAAFLPWQGLPVAAILAVVAFLLVVAAIAAGLLGRRAVRQG